MKSERDVLARQNRGLEKQVKFASIASSAQREKSKRQGVELSQLQDLHDETVAALNAARLELDLVSIRPPPHDVSARKRNRCERTLPTLPKRPAALATVASPSRTLADELQEPASAANSNMISDEDEDLLADAIAGAQQLLAKLSLLSSSAT